jgi:hypothetical protein
LRLQVGRPAGNPPNTRSGDGVIRRPQARGSTVPALAGAGALQLRVTLVPSLGMLVISAWPPASRSRAQMLLRSPVLAGPIRAGSKPFPRSRIVTSMPPARPGRAVTVALATPA